LAKPQIEIDEQIKNLCQTTSLDFQVVERVNENTEMMSPTEQETIFNTLNAIKVQAKDVILNHADISNYGIEILSEAFKNADSVHKLDLSYITTPIDVRGSQALSEMLKINLYIKTLILTHTRLDDKNVSLISEGVSLNRNLEVLVLCNNKITDKGAKSIISILSDMKKDQCLKLVDLSKNFLKDLTAKSIAKMLAKNNVLTRLYLNNNKITNKGIISISHALEDNLAIDQIYLYANSISPEIQVLAKKKHGDRILLSDSLL